jgi:hypothetical protein
MIDTRTPHSDSISEKSPDLLSSELHECYALIASSHLLSNKYGKIYLATMRQWETQR